MYKKFEIGGTPPHEYMELRLSGRNGPVEVFVQPDYERDESSTELAERAKLKIAEACDLGVTACSNDVALFKFGGHIMRPLAVCNSAACPFDENGGGSGREPRVDAPLTPSESAAIAEPLNFDVIPQSKH